MMPIVRKTRQTLRLQVPVLPRQRECQSKLGNVSMEPVHCPRTCSDNVGSETAFVIGMSGARSEPRLCRMQSNLLCVRATAIADVELSGAGRHCCVDALDLRFEFRSQPGDGAETMIATPLPREMMMSVMLIDMMMMMPGFRLGMARE